MKKIFILTATLMLALGTMAQVETTNVQIGAITAPAFTTSIQKDYKMVQRAMNQRLKEAGLKTKSSEGYVACLDQLCAEIATDPINLYTKVEKDGKSARVTVCAIPTNLANASDMQNQVRAFLEGFVNYVKKVEAQENMANEQDNLKKAKKKEESAASEVAKIEKAIKDYQDDIAGKQKDIEKFNEKIAECQKDIKKLQENIDKSREKKADAEKKLEEARSATAAVEKEVEKYRSLSE